VSLSLQSLRRHIAEHNTAVATLAARRVEQYLTSAAEVMDEAGERPKLSAEVRRANGPRTAGSRACSWGRARWRA
jgi:hypothetical protein